MESQSNNLTSFILGISLIIVLFVFDFFGLTRIMTSSVSPIMIPVRHGMVNVISLLERPFYFSQRMINSARKVQMLEYRYSEVLAQLSSLDQLKRENEELRNLLENSDRTADSIVISAPIVSDLGPSIGSGSNDGISEGDVVFVGQTLVGRVSKVFDDYATIHLVNQEEFQPLVVETQEGYKGLVRGDGKRAILTEIITDEEPTDESRIMTVGQVGVKGGYFVGQVGRRISTPADPVQTYIINQFVNFYEASVVEIYK